MTNYYEEPKMVKIRDILEKSTDSFKYIEKFEYGDFDNWVTAVIDTINVPLRFMHETNENVDGVDNKVCWVSLETVYKSIRAVEESGLRNAASFTGYGSSMKVATLSEILDKEIEVIGEWTN